MATLQKCQWHKTFTFATSVLSTWPFSSPSPPQVWGLGRQLQEWKSKAMTPTPCKCLSLRQGENWIRDEAEDLRWNGLDIYPRVATINFLIQMNMTGGWWGKELWRRRFKLNSAMEKNDLFPWFYALEFRLYNNLLKASRSCLLQWWKI